MRWMSIMKEINEYYLGLDMGEGLWDGRLRHLIIM